MKREGICDKIFKYFFNINNDFDKLAETCLLQAIFIVSDLNNLIKTAVEMLIKIIFLIFFKNMLDDMTIAV